ncbi:MAG: class C sortase [Clostridiales bacterium]|nr:class C sortase [Candidatus Apopatocola equi]
MKKKKRFSDYIFALIFLAGLSLLLYPTFSNYWNSLHSTQVIANYSERVVGMEKDTMARMRQEAEEYNAAVALYGRARLLTDEERLSYLSVLDITGTGIIGYIQIDSLGVNLPIYHGTDEGVLQIAAGHVEWSSLPVGGPSTHCVLSGHRGLPSAKLFTDLDQLREGDTFALVVLDEILTYEVDQIRIVEPHEVGDLSVEEGKDYCTLVTCTPYGINTHRLLVRGHRIENAESAASVRITAEAIQIEPLLVSSVLAVPALLLLLITVMVGGKKKEKRSDRRE